jgi:xanthine dehydrogenase accessory factor
VSTRVPNRTATVRRLRLVILGAGHVGQALARVAAAADIAHSVVDDRSAFARPELFPRAAPLLCDRFPEGLRRLEPDRSTAVVIATRCHTTDLVCLEHALETDAGYIGLVCSRAKALHLTGRLARRGIDATGDARVHAPVGLDLGGKAPEVIAVSAIAEILCGRHTGAVPHRRDLAAGHRSAIPEPG